MSGDPDYYTAESLMDALIEQLDARKADAAEIARFYDALVRIWNPANWDERKGGNWWGDSHPREIAFAALEAAKKKAPK